MEAILDGLAILSLYLAYSCVTLAFASMMCASIYLLILLCSERHDKQ